jgi:hypothetical protein
MICLTRIETGESSAWKLWKNRQSLGVPAKWVTAARREPKFCYRQLVVFGYGCWPDCPRMERRRAAGAHSAADHYSMFSQLAVTSFPGAASLFAASLPIGRADAHSFCARYDSGVP